jgi:hypothetical protein
MPGNQTKSSALPAVACSSESQINKLRSDGYKWASKRYQASQKSAPAHPVVTPVPQFLIFRTKAKNARCKASLVLCFLQEKHIPVAANQLRSGNRRVIARHDFKSC